ncbi:MAG: hypothetical protein M3P85_11745 [Actinomycetota bacterium]|nr:hypothetical protein [Actinomycetota bacterium]
MPWCEACSRFVEDSDTGSPERCPGCGRTVASHAAEPSAPWHFKLLVAAVVAYLGFRAYQGAVWLLGHL